ncbi:MAG: hypothetical protein LBU51_06540 [Bacteroidales bacterium]|nr:hypothetical protein [Bacteroidales bacterium]
MLQVSENEFEEVEIAMKIDKALTVDLIVEDTTIENDISVFPNPANNIVIVQIHSVHQEASIESIRPLMATYYWYFIWNIHLSDTYGMWYNRAFMTFVLMFRKS